MGVINLELSAIGQLLVSLVSVFTSITSHVDDVLAIFASSVVLILLLGFKFSGAIYGFAGRLLRRR
jgi:hypothetical protein